MKVTCTPTPELDEITINGTKVPMRIWRGVTEGGTRLELLVLSIVPHKDDVEKLKQEIPDFMKPSRKVFQIADFPDETETKQ